MAWETWALNALLIYLTATLVITIVIGFLGLGLFVDHYTPLNPPTDSWQAENGCFKFEYSGNINTVIPPKLPPQDMAVLFNKKQRGFLYTDTASNEVCEGLKLSKRGDTLIANGAETAPGKTGNGWFISGIGWGPTTFWNPWVIRTTAYDLENKGKFTCIDLNISFTGETEFWPEYDGNMSLYSQNYDFLVAEGSCSSGTMFNFPLLVVLGLLFIYRKPLKRLGGEVK